MDRPINYNELVYYADNRPLEGYSYAKLLELASLEREKTPWAYLRIRQFALEELLVAHSKPTLEENPLVAGSVLCMVGKSVFKATALKARLEALNIQYATKINDETTHVLLGSNPKNTRNLEDYTKTLLTDQLLQATLDHLEQPYLQEQGEETIENLSDLLMSLEVDNVLIALELIKGGGFPVELIPQAFWAMKSTSNKTIYKGFKGVLDKYLSPAGKKAIRRTLKVDVTTPEIRLTRKLHDFCEDVPDLDALAIAQQLFKYYKKGMQYIWRYSEDAALIKSTLEGCIENHVLDLTNKGVSTLPKELGEYQQIHTVILKNNDLAAVPNVLYKLPALTHLDLSFNYKMKNFSTRLLEMEQLRHLNLYGRVPYWNISAITQLTQLEELVLKENRYHQGHYGVGGIRRALPHCKVIALP